MIPIINNPDDRTFSKTYALMRARRAAMPADPLAGFRRRRTSDAAIAGCNLPPLSEPEVLKPLSVATIDAIDDDEPDEVTIPEVCAPVPAVEAGTDEPEQSDLEYGDGEARGAEAEL
jgi:hypothetical protein